MKRKLNAGFTLIELMIVVAIIGVLAVLAIYGVSKYLKTAKTAEATNSIGAINRGAIAAYDRESSASQLLTGGGTSSAATHALCDSSAPVPATLTGGVKYTPNPAAGSDYSVGSSTAGWPCVRFEMTEPQYYQYAYTKGATAQIANNGDLTLPAGAAWLAEAKGDLDNNGTFSNFVTGGGIDATSKKATTFTQIAISNETE